MKKQAKPIIRREMYNVISYKEVERLVARFLGVSTYETLVADMEWTNDTVHAFEVEPKRKWIQPNHKEHIEEVRARRKVVWLWELVAILEELAAQRVLPTGNYLIEVCW